MTLIRANASTAANAPPTRSFAQPPPMATANRMCRLLITAQPMFSMVVPMVITTAISAPAICTSLPRLIIRPAAGITAMTCISTLPSFCRKSKLIMPFFLHFLLCFGFPGRLSICSGCTGRLLFYSVSESMSYLLQQFRLHNAAPYLLCRLSEQQT